MNYILPFKDNLSLNIQKTIARLTLPLWYCGSVIYLKCIQGYRIKEIQRLRQQFKNILAEQKNPLLICANHLTKIDSLIIQWGLASVCTYSKNFKAFAWNLPEYDRFKNNLFFRFVCYIGCCIPINRGGEREKLSRSLNKIKHLLANKHLVMIFPEGQRSITGKIDPEEFAYGVGKLVQDIEDCEILCVYLRGKEQHGKSNFPKRNESFTINMKKVFPISHKKGLRANREIASQVIQELIKMEEEYFACSWQ